MSHRTTPASQGHKLETSTIDGEVRGACTCGWHHRGSVRSLAAVREGHERHVAKVTFGPWRPKKSSVHWWVVQRERADGSTDTYRKTGFWIWARPSRFLTEAAAQSMADKLNANGDQRHERGVEHDPEAPAPRASAGVGTAQVSKAR
jgi:hypothetical protein